MPETPEVNGFVEKVSNGKGVYDDGVEMEAEADEIEKESIEVDVSQAPLDKIMGAGAASTDLTASLDLKKNTGGPLAQAKDECKH